MKGENRMEKSLYFRGIVRVSPYDITLKSGDGIDLVNAVREMMGVGIDKYEDVAGEFVISMNCYVDLEINGEKFEVAKGE